MNTLVVFQCCKRKNGIERYPHEDYDLSSRIPETWFTLEKAIENFTVKGIIRKDSPKISAISRYNGFFYRVEDFRETIVREIRLGTTDFLIMSAAYGFVHPFQRIHRYEQRMTGKTTRYWLKVGLSKVLSEYICSSHFTHVYGFFSKTAEYRKIFEEVPWKIHSNLKEAGYFALEGLIGAPNVLQTLSRMSLHLIQTQFFTIPHEFEGGKVLFTPMNID